MGARSAIFENDHASIDRQSTTAKPNLSFSNFKIVIATRESRLALWQARHVAERLSALGAQPVLHGMTTRGDQILDRSLSKVGGKGLFVKELEQALEQGVADLAVHSLKDVPMQLPTGFELACVMKREDPRDALVCTHYPSLQELPNGARVGTSSLRRTVQLHALRPDLNIEPLRGNLDTRLRKLDEGQYDGIVLAAAGLIRLDAGHRIRQFFEPEQILPSAGQGALAIEIRSDRSDLRRALQSLTHADTWVAVTAERAVSRSMGGSCSMPLAAYAFFEGQGDARELRIDAAWGDLEGSAGLIRVHAKGRAESEMEADQLGRLVAERLRQAGAP